jgi:hypothetical protein
MIRQVLTAIAFVGIVASGPAHAESDYVGPFPTQRLYAMCSDNNPAERDKCNFYIQGMIYGLNIQIANKDMKACLPKTITTEAARLKILQFIDGTTGGKPASNKDGGDWMAFMGLAAGNLCKR